MTKARLTDEKVEVTMVTLEPGDRLAIQVPGQSGHLMVDEKGNMVLVGFEGSYYSYTRQQWHDYGKGAHRGKQASAADAG